MPNPQTFIDKASALRLAMYELKQAWQSLDVHTQDVIDHPTDVEQSYPFALAFDEQLLAVENWVEGIEQRLGVAHV